MNASNKLCKELLCEYSDYREYDDDEFVGYKLAEKRGGPNYYSIVSGMFRYKARWVANRSYSGLYEKEKIHYDNHLLDKLSLFVKKEDAYEALKEYENIADYETHLVMLEITLKGELERAKYSNAFVKDREVVIGSIMDKVKEIKI